MNISTLFHMFLICHWVSFSVARMDSNKSYTATWAVQLNSSAKEDDVQFIANTLGLTYQKILPDNYYLLTDEHNQNLLDKPNEQITDAFKSFSMVIWVEQQVAKDFESRAEFSDPLWMSQPHLKSRSREFKTAQRIEDVWAKGYTGKGVTVVVIDDGVRGTHDELKHRYDKTVSAIIANRSSQTSVHGTGCAGVIAAEANNGLCGVGVAYGCKIAGIRLFDDKTATDAHEAQAFYRDHINPSMVDIFSNSWGPPDDGYTIGSPGRLAEEALKHGIQKGRHSLGSIYVFSCGNGARFDDSCAFDGYVNSIYTIPVASITKDGKVTDFSEPCSAIMTAVYSSDMVTLSGKSDSGCVRDFGRTSAAAAFVSGILALALEANRNITWRDMQYLIARSSNWNNVDPAIKPVTNAKKYRVNENFGFGVLDAPALIKNAKSWNISVPAQMMCTLNVTAELGTQTIPTKLNINISEDKLSCTSKLIKSLEHVQLRVDLDYTNRAVLAIDVESTSGTLSRFVYPRSYDVLGYPRTYNNLVVTSVHFWEERLLGTWTVDIKQGTGTHQIQGTGTLFNMSLIFYGTTEIPNNNGIKTDPMTVTATTHRPTLPPPPCGTWCIILITVGILVALVIGVVVALKLKGRLRRSAQDESGHGELELSKNSDTVASAHQNKFMV